MSPKLFKLFSCRYSCVRSPKTVFCVSLASTEPSASDIIIPTSAILAALSILLPMLAPFAKLLASFVPLVTAFAALYKALVLDADPPSLLNILIGPCPAVKYIVAILPSEYPNPPATVSAQKLAVPSFWKVFICSSLLVR